MNWKSILTVDLKKPRDSLRKPRTLFLTIVIPTIVMPVMLFGMGKIMSKVMTTAREEVPVVMVGVWPLCGIGPVHFLFIQ